MSLNFRSSLSMGLFAWLMIIAICSSVEADEGDDPKPTKDHYCYKLNEMTEINKYPELKEEDKQKCDINQCFRMKYWIEKSATGKKLKDYPGYFGGCRDDLPGRGGPWEFPNDCKDYTVSRTHLDAFLGSSGDDKTQRWKLDGPMLKNKEGAWKSDDDWEFKPQINGLIYIENISKTKVLGSTSDGKVIEEVKEVGKAEQLWKKGQPDAEGYFTLQNSGEPKVLTAISESSLEIKDRGDGTKKTELEKLVKEGKLKIGHFKKWIDTIRNTSKEMSDDDKDKFKYDYKVELCYCKNEKDGTPCNGKAEDGTWKTIGVSKSGVATLALTIVLLAISIIGVWFFVKSCQVDKKDP